MNHLDTARSKPPGEKCGLVSCAALNRWLKNSRVGMRLFRLGLGVVLLQLTLGNVLHAQSMSHGMDMGMSAMTQETSHETHHCEDMDMSMDTSHMQHDAGDTDVLHSPDCCKSSQCQCACMIMPMVSMHTQIDGIGHELVPVTVLLAGPHSRLLITPFRPPIQ